MSPRPQPSVSKSILLEKLALIVQIAYMLRIPVLLGAVVFLFPMLAHFVAPTLLGGLYDFSEAPFLSAFWYALFTFLFAWVVMISSKLCFHGGPQRLALPENDARKWFRKVRTKVEDKNLLFFAVSIFSVFTISGVFWVKRGEFIGGHYLQLIGGSLAGFTFSCMLLYLADVLHSLFKPPGVTFTTIHLFPGKFGPLKRLRSKPENLPIIKRLFKVFERPVEWFRGKEVLSRGYFAVTSKPDRPLPPISGHVTALTLMTVYMVVYAIFGFGHRFIPIEDLSQSASSYQQILHIPALVYIPILCTMLCWALSAVSFFLDGFRIPLLLPVALWVFIGSFWQESYYTVRNSPPIETRASEPGPAIKDDYMILVSADGGGIQAAAWTARVLTGISERCPGCASKIRLISGVSGGSVGAMYYVDALNDQNRGHPSSSELQFVRTRAASSSLRSVAWGLAYPDLLNAFFPFFTYGRGDELEQGWGRNLRVAGDPAPAKTDRFQEPLSTWKPGIVAGWRPDVIFNATMVESGGRVLMTTSDLLDKNEDYTKWDKRFTFHDLYPESDITIASAVRMSASFPYVTPVARPRLEDGVSEPAAQYKLERYRSAHLADGGYFDNYGTVSLLEWLDARLRQPDAPKKVLIIQIRCGDVTSVKSNDDEHLPRVYQFAAPLTTLYNVRTAGQRERSDKEIEVVQKLRDDHYKGADIRSIIFNFSAGVDTPAEPPLSWHLAPLEKEQICRSWSDVVTDQNNFQEINNILAAFGVADRIRDDKAINGNCDDPKEINSLGF